MALRRTDNKALSLYSLPGYSLGGAIVLVVSEVLLFLRTPVVTEYFYVLAWWPYILLVDGLVFRKTGWSILKKRPWAMWDLGLWSVTFWLIFELFNLRLSNWHYVDLVANPYLRWSTYTLAYATVLPGMFETYLLLRAYGVFKHRRIRPFAFGIKRSGISMAFGAAMLILCLVFPRYLFALVWGGFLFLLDPVNFKLACPSLLHDLSKGRADRTLQLLLAGLICGFLWEFWNFWARCKWIYTVPFVGDVKLFEMPVLGFLGFPPFCLECYAMYGFVAGIGLALNWDPEAREGGLSFSRALILGFMLPFWAMCYYLIDQNTVLSFWP